MQNKKLILAGLAGMVAGALVACGGGGGSSPSSGSGSASGVTLSGTAASGLAIAGGTVSISCQGATGSATTQTNGTYTVTVSGGSLPCALSVTSGGQTYRSVVAGTGSSATANITPLTEMLVGALLQQNPTALDGGAPSTTVTSSALQVAQTAVINYLQANDIDVSALSGTDFVSTPLVAATTTPGTGDAQDQVLDTLKAANVNPSAVATVLQSAPSGCAFAKSGKYTLINYLGEVSSATVDFTTNTIALGTSAPVSFSASSTYPCEYVAGTTTVNFASSGLAIYKDTTDNVIGIALPTQAFSTSLYGDTYNLSGYFAANSGPFALNTGNSTNDQLPNAQIATMKIGTDRSVIICADSTTTTCSDGSDSFSATVNGDGSVDLLESGATTSTDKVYTYVAPNGKKLLVLANASTKSFLIGAKQEAIDPAKIEPNAVWFQVQGYAGYSGSGWSGATVASGTSVTTAITATQGTVTQHFDDGTAARDDIMLWNTTTGSDTWNGMRHRNAVTSPTNVAARTGLSAIGMGFATSGSVNGGTPAAPLLPSGKPGFTMSVKRIVQ